MVEYSFEIYKVITILIRKVPLNERILRNHCYLIYTLRRPTFIEVHVLVRRGVSLPTDSQPYPSSVAMSDTHHNCFVSFLS